jgi:N-methylhydantoinase A
MSNARRRVRVGIDVGGTFTDLVALDEAGAPLARIKVPSTPRAPELGVLAALSALLEDVPPQAIALLSHSSTIATNALLGQMHLKLPRIALLTTEGFRDVLEIGRQNRSEVYNLSVKRPRPLVERRRRLGVRERCDPFGAVVVPLEAPELERVASAVERLKVSGVAISYLHAYANPLHERATRTALHARMPHLEVTLSSDVDPEYREYERTSTAVVNALLRPLVRGYLERLATGARERGVGAPIYVMQSSGGTAALDAVVDHPATMLESGPAAGAIGAAFLGRALGLENVLSFDMGGTTAKAGTIVGGEPQIALEFEAAGRTHSGRAVKGSGYPVRFPFVDLAEVSAGGGTIAFVDEGGALRVGPLSAGADPGPAAYGRGRAATVTDANFVLGRLGGRALLGGALPVDVARSKRALARLRKNLPELDRDRLDLDGLAAGIVRIVDSEMAKILRIVTVERGLDPRDFTLIAFGGAGPLHACALARDLAIPRIVIPPDPGLFSAFGLLAADVRASAVRTFVERVEVVDPAEVEAAFRVMEVDGRQELRRQGVAAKAIAFVRELDMRYLGQGFELSIPAPKPFDLGARGAALARFHEKHAQTYGYAAPEIPVEIVSARSTALGTLTKPVLATLEARGAAEPAPGALLERRSVYQSGAGRTDTPVYARAALAPGNRLAGPALVEQYDSCTLIAPGWLARIDTGGNIVMELDA